MEIRLLHRGDLEAFRALRLFALQDSPTAFSSDYSEEIVFETSDWERYIASGTDGAILGAFVGSDLVGIAGIYRQKDLKIKHKATIWTVFVHPSHRRCGLGRQLMEATRDHALSLPGVHHLLLSVAANNHAAQGLYEGVGFRAYATERDYLLVDGQLYDEVFMAYFR